MTLNARVGIGPGALGGLAMQAIQETATGMQVSTRILEFQSFSPPYPRPPFRVPTPH